jgi:hypothetical protein
MKSQHLLDRIVDAANQARIRSGLLSALSRIVAYC